MVCGGASAPRRQGRPWPYVGISVTSEGWGALPSIYDEQRSQERSQPSRVGLAAAASGFASPEGRPGFSCAHWCWGVPLLARGARYCPGNEKPGTPAGPRSYRTIKYSGDEARIIKQPPISASPGFRSVKLRSSRLQPTTPKFMVTYRVAPRSLLWSLVSPRLSYRSEPAVPKRTTPPSGI